MEFTLGTLLVYLLIVFRIMGCLLFLPFFGPGMATVIKAALALFLSYLVLPAASLEIAAPVLDLFYVLLAAQEVLTGILIGFVVRLTFSVISIAGEMASQEMGFRMSVQVDPLTGNKTPAVSQFYQLFAYLLFIGVNGHHWIIEILSRSFRAVPIGTLNLNAGFGEWFGGLFTRFFSLGIQLAAPIFLLMLMISVGVGLLAKLVEGINVFDIGFPIRIGVGLLFIMFFIPFLSQTLHKVFQGVQDGLLELLMVI